MRYAVHIMIFQRRAPMQTLAFLRRDRSDLHSESPRIAAPRTILVSPSKPRKGMGIFHKQLLEAVGVANFSPARQRCKFPGGIPFGIKHGHNMLSLQCDILERHVESEREAGRSAKELCKAKPTKELPIHGSAKRERLPIVGRV